MYQQLADRMAAIEARLGRPRRPPASPYIWFVPIAVILIAILAYPWINALVLSLHDYNLLSGRPPRWIGLANYLNAFSDGDFRLALKNTGVLVVVTVACQLALGLGIALLLNAVQVARSALLVLYLLPVMLTPSVAALSWKLLLQEQWGVLNWVLTTVGLHGVGWLSDPNWTLPTIIMIDVWQHTPFGVLILLAGLQGVPQEQLEAAKVDGANYFRLLRHIVLPFIAPLIVITVLFRIIFALRTFDAVYVLFGVGGPGNAGIVLGTYVYSKLQVTWDLGQASAVSYIILVLTGLGTILFIRQWYRAETR